MYVAGKVWKIDNVEVNYTLKQLRKNYYTSKIEENKDNSKKTWQVMREAMGQGGKIS